MRAHTNTFPVRAATVFILLNIFLYVFMFCFQNRIPFNRTGYKTDAHHYLEDPRIKGGEAGFLRALNQYDGQWYTFIAEKGYPKNPRITDLRRKEIMDGLAYGFFPLYPTLLFIINRFVGDVELAAFITAALFLAVNSFVLFRLIEKTDNKETAIKTVFLLFFSPFSIYYRGYYAEGLFLFLILLFMSFLNEKKYTKAAFFLSLANITRGAGILLNLYFLMRCRLENTPKKTCIKTTVILTAPFLFWVVYNAVQTGDPLYFLHLRTAYYSDLKNISFFTPFYFILLQIMQTVTPPRFLLQTIGGIFFLGNLLLLSLIKISTHPKMWWLWASMIGSVLISTGAVWGWGRYSIVIFPLFYFLARRLKGRSFYLLCSFNLVLLFIISLYFINGYFLG